MQKKQKLSLASIKEKLSRTEMKQIMAGSRPKCNEGGCQYDYQCGTDCICGILQGEQHARCHWEG